MKLVQVENGQIVKYTLPKVGTLKDGSTVSGYDTLMLSNPDLAKEEGWLPLIDEKPEYDPEVESLTIREYEILEDKVIVKYDINKIQDVELTQPTTGIDDYILDMDFRLSLIELNI